MPRIRAANITEHKAMTRRQVLDAAYLILESSGYEGLTLGEVAAEIGIGRTTLYQYFAHRDDLLAALVEDLLPDVIERLVGSAPVASDYSNQLAELALKTVDFIASDPVLGLILHREVSKLSSEAQTRVLAAHAGLGQAFGQLYGRGVASGELVEMPVRLAGRFIEGLIMAAAKFLIESENAEEERAGIEASLVGMLLGGLKLQ